MIEHFRKQNKAQKTIRRLKYEISNFFAGRKFTFNGSQKPKIFCIGRNKTGTTSLKMFFENFGFRVGNQAKAERLFPHYRQGSYQPIIDYCKTAQVFQDCPFSYPNTYKYLDEAFPNSLFILSVRDSAEQWYQSLTKFRVKMFGYLPQAADLKKSKYAYEGYLWETHQFLYDTPPDDLFNSEILQNHYLQYNQDVADYFHGRKNFIVVNLSKDEDYGRLCEFVKAKPVPNSSFPWENKT